MHTNAVRSTFLFFMLVLMLPISVSAETPQTQTEPSINVVFVDDRAIGLAEGREVRLNNWSEWERRLPTFIHLLSMVGSFRRDRTDGVDGSATVFGVELAESLPPERRKLRLTDILRQIHAKTKRPSAILARSTKGLDQLRFVVQDSIDYTPESVVTFLEVLSDISPLVPPETLGASFGPFTPPPTFIFDPLFPPAHVTSDDSSRAVRRWALLEEAYLLPHYVLHAIAVVNANTSLLSSTFYPRSSPEPGTTVGTAKRLSDVYIAGAGINSSVDRGETEVLRMALARARPNPIVVPLDLGQWAQRGLTFDNPKTATELRTFTSMYTRRGQVEGRDVIFDVRPGSDPYLFDKNLPRVVDIVDYMGKATKWKSDSTLQAMAFDSIVSVSKDTQYLGKTHLMAHSEAAWSVGKMHETVNRLEIHKGRVGPDMITPVLKRVYENGGESFLFTGKNDLWSMWNLATKSVSQELAKKLPGVFALHDRNARGIVDHGLPLRESTFEVVSAGGKTYVELNPTAFTGDGLNQSGTLHTSAATAQPGDLIVRHGKNILGPPLTLGLLDDIPHMGIIGKNGLAYDLRVNKKEGKDLSTIATTTWNDETRFKNPGFFSVLESDIPVKHNGNLTTLRELPGAVKNTIRETTCRLADAQIGRTIGEYSVAPKDGQSRHCGDWSVGIIDDALGQNGVIVQRYKGLAAFTMDKRGLVDGQLRHWFVSDITGGSVMDPSKVNDRLPRIANPASSRNSWELGGILFDKGNIYRLDVSGVVRAEAEKASSAVGESGGISGVFNSGGENHLAVGIPVGSAKPTSQRIDTPVGRFLAVDYRANTAGSLPLALPRFWAKDNGIPVFAGGWTFEALVAQGVSEFAGRRSEGVPRVTIQVFETGNALRYNHHESGKLSADTETTYVPEGGPFWPDLLRNDDGSYSFRLRHGVIVIFDSGGLIKALTSPRGERVDYVRSKSQSLQRQEMRNQSFAIESLAQSPLRVVATESEKVRYSYSEGRLAEVSAGRRPTLLSYGSGGVLASVAKDGRVFKIHSGDDDRLWKVSGNSIEARTAFRPRENALELSTGDGITAIWLLGPRKRVAGVITQGRAVLWTRTSEGRIMQMAIGTLTPKGDAYEFVPLAVAGASL